MPNMNIRSAVLKLLTDVGIFISFYLFALLNFVLAEEPSLPVLYVLMDPTNLIPYENFMPLVVSN